MLNVDGSTLTMPDTAANQEEYPQPPNQKPGFRKFACHSSMNPSARAKPVAFFKLHAANTLDPPIGQRVR